MTREHMLVHVLVPGGGGQCTAEGQAAGQEPLAADGNGHEEDAGWHRRSRRPAAAPGRCSHRRRPTRQPTMSSARRIPNKRGAQRVNIAPCNDSCARCMAVMYTRVTHSTFRTLALLQLPKLHCSHTFRQRASRTQRRTRFPLCGTRGLGTRSALARRGRPGRRRRWSNHEDKRKPSHVRGHAPPM